MFKTIIVGVDGREDGRDALALAARFAQIFGGDLVAVHAHPYESYVGHSAGGAYEQVMRDHTRKLARDEVEGAGVAAHAVVVADGSPARALHRAATGHDGELIVVGSAHRGRVGRVLTGDVTAGTLHGAPCPVLVAPAGYAQRGGELGTIGVGFDGSPELRAAVGLAREIVETARAGLRVIEVVVPPEPGGPFPAYRPDWAERARIRRQEAEEQVAGIVAGLGDTATGDIAFGDPTRELAHEANHLDLLIVGSRGYGPFRRLMLGSTSRKLVRDAPCPVLVLTRLTEDQAEAVDAASSAAA